MAKVEPKYCAEVAELHGDLRCGEIVELLEQLCFDRRREATCTLTLDRDVRSLLVDALRRR